MKIVHLATNSFVIMRKSTTSGFKKVYATLTGFNANLQPASLEKTSLVEGVMGKTFTVYMDGCIDVKEFDQLRDDITGKMYQVKSGGVTRRTYGAVDYKEVIVEEIA